MCVSAPRRGAYKVTKLSPQGEDILVFYFTTLLVGMLYGKGLGNTLCLLKLQRSKEVQGVYPCLCLCTKSKRFDPGRV